VLRHFYNLNEFTKDQIEHFLERALYQKQNRYLNTLANKEFALLFLNPSLRTRCSFEVAIRQLGGGVTTLEGQSLWKLETETGKKMDEDKSEHVTEAMGVLSRYFDGLGIRAFARGVNRQEDLLDQTFCTFMENAKIPIFNMESAVYHPCQAMADLLTIKELLQGFSGRRITIMWASHPLALPMAVANSILIASTLAGMEVTLAHPEGFELQEGIVALGRDFARRSGGSLRVVHDRQEAARGAEVIYAKAWGGLSRYDDPQGEMELRKKNSQWIVDAQLMELTQRAYFMHCLPVRRNVVVTDDVIDSKQSVIFRQSENRLHAQKAILEWVYQ
jgi:N-acetylornithine carbamoyltransferase